MLSIIRKCTPWLLPTVLVLFILEVVCLPLVVKFTWPTDRPSPEHVLTYTKGKLTWDDATLVDPITGAAKLNIFDDTYDEAQSDNGEHIIAPGLSKTSVVRLFNTRLNNINYYATLYYKKSTEDIPIVLSFDPENTYNGMPDGYTLPPEITGQGYTILRTCRGYVPGEEMTDFVVNWEWPFEDPSDIDGRDAIDTELGDRAALGDFETADVGLYIYIEDTATDVVIPGGGGGGGGDKPDVPDVPVDPDLPPDGPDSPDDYEDDDVIITHPDGSITYPDGKEEAEDGTVTYPDGTVVSPDGSIIHPDGSVTKPGTGTTTGSGTVIYPDGTVVHKPAENKHPNATITRPDGTIVFPNGSVMHPTGVITYPDGTVLYPDGMIKYPTSGDGSGNAPQFSNPIGATTTKQDTILYPDGAMLHPCKDPLYTGAEILHPNGTLSKPQGGLIYGGGVMVYADGTVLYPDGIIRHPDGTYVYPTNLVYKPDGSIVYPDGTIIYPLGKDSGSKPTVVKPTGGTPDTGDSSNMALYGALVIMTLIVLLLLMLEKKMEARRSKK